VLLVALVARLPSLVLSGVAILGAEYAVSLLLRGGTIDGKAPLFAVGLLLVAEGSYWSFEPHLPSDPGIAGRRLGRLAILGLVGGGVSALVLAVSELAAEGGLGLEALGVAAAGGALTLVALLALSAARHQGSGPS
jgi:hypothetical protein